MSGWPFPPGPFNPSLLLWGCQRARELLPTTATLPMLWNGYLALDCSADLTKVKSCQVTMISGHYGKSLSVGNSRKKVLRMIKREREQCKMWHHLVIMLWLFFPFLFQTCSTTKNPTTIVLLCCSLGLARAQLFGPVLSWEHGLWKQQPWDPPTPLPVSICFSDAGPESKIGKKGRMWPRKLTLRPSGILGITMVLFVLFFFIILKHFI